MAKRKPKKNSARTVPHVDLNLRVLGYKEARRWVAHCLEMDLLGYGKTFEDALVHLSELVEMQLSFAIDADDPALIWQQAPLEIIETYLALSEAVRNSYPDEPRYKDRKMGFITLPPADEIPKFRAANG